MNASELPDNFRVWLATAEIDGRIDGLSLHRTEEGAKLAVEKLKRLYDESDGKLAFKAERWVVLEV